MPAEVTRREWLFRNGQVVLWVDPANPRAYAAAQEIKSSTSIPERQLTIQSTKDGSTHLLVYLNKDTFYGTVGDTFAQTVREHRENGGKVVCLHECDLSRGGCPWSTVVENTPMDLLLDGLYPQAAETILKLHGGPHREVSIAIVCKKLGAWRGALAKSTMQMIQLDIARGGTPLSSTKVHPEPEWHPAGAGALAGDVEPGETKKVVSEL